jgi:hypothetical protein
MLCASTANRFAQIAYCRAHMLPIWEYWTNGNPAVRDLLACGSADLALFDRCHRELRTTASQLRKGCRNARVAAALAAASVVCSAYIGVPERQFQRACYLAEEAGRLAIRVAGRR